MIRRLRRDEERLLTIHDYVYRVSSEPWPFYTSADHKKANSVSPRAANSHKRLYISHARRDETRRARSNKLSFQLSFAATGLKCADVRAYGAPTPHGALYIKREPRVRHRDPYR